MLLYYSYHIMAYNLQYNGDFLIISGDFGDFMVLSVISGDFGDFG